jgi:hypothetical protein
VDVHLGHLLDALAQLACRLHRVRAAQLGDGRLKEAGEVVQRVQAAIPTWAGGVPPGVCASRW